MNSSFDKANKRENVSEGPLTRRQSLSSSHTSKKSKPLGNAIIDKELLEECIVKSAVCSSCRNAKLKLELCQDGKDGLAEHLYLICSHCNAKTVLEMSKKITEHNFSDRKEEKNPYQIMQSKISHCFTINRSCWTRKVLCHNGCKIFLRSIEQRKLKFVLLVGDGDTGCFGAVSEACKKVW